jgi:hypothetical protein
MHQHIRKVELPAATAAVVTGAGGEEQLSTIPAAAAGINSQALTSCAEGACRLQDSSNSAAAAADAAAAGASPISSRRSSFEYVPAAAGSDAADLQDSIAAAAAGPATASSKQAAAAAAYSVSQGRERVDNMLDDLKDLVYVPRGYICSSTQVSSAA